MRIKTPKDDYRGKPVLAFIVTSFIVFGSCQKNRGAHIERPPGNGYHAMAYDAESRRVILFGGQDLYISFQKQDGTWTSAKNMGSVLNTDSDEMFPLVTSDGKYLFFGGSYGAAERSHWVDIYWVDAKIIEELRPKGLQSRENEQ